MKKQIQSLKNFPSRIGYKFGVFALALSVLQAGCSHKESKPNATSSQNVEVRGGNYHLHPFEEKTLPNGLHILFVPDESLPYLTLSMLIKSGSDQDPEGQFGLAQMVAELIEKGSVKRNATQIAEDLGSIGAEFSSSAGSDFTHMTISGLSMHGEKLLTDFSEMILQPAFSEKEVERVRKQLLAQNERRIDNVEAFADIAFAEYIYGAHPYGHPSTGTLKTLRAIKKKNVIQHYVRFFRPNNALLAVVGKYTSEFADKIEAAFSSWQMRDVPTGTFSPIIPAKGIQIRLIDKPASTQAQIRMGEIGIKRQSPDFLAVRLANTVLGGAFLSRLSSRVRTQLGLTYGIESYFDARIEPGPFEISTFSKNSTAGQTIAETLNLLGEFKTKGITAGELERTKSYLKGVFPTAIETPEKLALNLMLLRLYGVPDSYLTNYLHDVDQLSLSSVNQVVSKYFDNKNIKILVYSSATEVLPQLEKIAPVEVKKSSDY